MTHEAHSVRLRSFSVRPEKCCAGVAVSRTPSCVAGLPPVELGDALGRHAHLDQPRANAQRHEVALHALRQVLDGRDVEVVVVVVREDQPLDRRQLLERQRRRVEALRARPLNGEARSLNTGSISQYLPRSLSRCEEWPSRITWLACGSSASSCAAVSGRTGIGSTGTVSVLLAVRKRDQIFQLPAAGASAGWAGSGSRSP